MKISNIKMFFLLLIIYTTDALPQHLSEELLNLTDFTFIRDTVYTLKPYFIEVNLATQKGYLHSRTDSVKEFGISSGTKRLKDGVDTKEGLFVIQSMMPKWHSRQFDSTLMLNWMGFNYGIGFHALLGKGYYRYLGKRKSSHGCLRISRATAEELYSKVELGTPVLVHNDDNAVLVSFIDSAAAFKYYKSDKLIDRLKNRYSSIYKGRYYVDEREPIVIDFTNVSHPGLPIGSRKLIPKRQIVKPEYIYVLSVTPPALGVVKIEVPGNMVNPGTYNLKLLSPVDYIN
jgi:hypothetical protein